MHHTKYYKLKALLFLSLILILAPREKVTANGDFNAWRNADQWDVAGDAMLDPDNNKFLKGKPGQGVLINGKKGKARSLVTKKRDYQDVEIHLEFMVSKYANSGVIFHGLYEIQIHDSYGIDPHHAGHCGGIYPRAENEPKYHHIDKGSPARVNASRPAGEWQSMDIIFQAPRFDKNGNKIAHAKFVKVIHNGKVIQKNKEVKYTSGANWRAKQVPRGPVILQGDYGPIAFRNIRIRSWTPGKENKLNVPPQGFKPLFNGRDLSGWRLNPKYKHMWVIEDGILKSHGLMNEWGASISTVKKYQDFVLMLEFRMPTISDSGIHFRSMIQNMEGFGNAEQLNIRSKGGMGHLESFLFMPDKAKKKIGITKRDAPQMRHIDPEVGVWHSIKITLIKKNITAEYDGEVIINKFEYPEGIISLDPAPIRLQKHKVVHGDNIGATNACPIEYRNIFIKELKKKDDRSLFKRKESLKASKSNIPVSDLIRSIIKESGIKGGLVAFVGCDKPSLLTDLHKAGPYLVHALDNDRNKVNSAQKYLYNKKLYGSITVSHLSASRLPYVESLVNMIVIFKPTDIPINEMKRVLSPGGVIVHIRNSKIETTQKEWPEEIDEWTHYLYDAHNNAVSKDTKVGPSRGLRWTCGPAYARSHEHFSSVSAMVTSKGRIFYIIDEGPVRSVYMQPKWSLIARDAFSGVLLWKKSISNWESHLRGFRSGPPEIGRRLIAKNDRVYVCLEYGSPVTVLDASTGKEIMTIEDTDGARELLLTDGILYVLADDMTADQHNKRKQWINRISPTLDQWFRFPRKPIHMYGKQRIVSIKAESGKRLWETEFNEPGEIAPTTIAVNKGRICVQTVSHVVCLDASNGKQLWRAENPIASSRPSWSTPTLVIHDNVVLTVDRNPEDTMGDSIPLKGSQWIIFSSGGTEIQKAKIKAFSLDDGKELWEAPCWENYNTPQDIFIINNVVWIGNLKVTDTPGFIHGRDLKTGKIIKTIPPQKGYGHHRCYRNKATVNWILIGRNGIQFLNPKEGEYEKTSFARGSCQYGVMPANGLVYVPQHSCACNPDGLLIGLNALSPESSYNQTRTGKRSAPLEKGPAYDEIRDITSHSSAKDWPTFRRNNQRNSYQDLDIPKKLKSKWGKKLSAPITAPVAANGMVIVAEIDRHTLHAFSDKDGKPIWKFTADGRIDSPPTLFNGLCIFGTRNGYVYCLRDSDGMLAWRFRASSQDMRIFSYEQLESVWPVHGSVLVDDELTTGKAVVYFAAGRSSSIDGGIRLYALELKTGKVLHQTYVRWGQGNNKVKAQVMPDILSLQKDTIWMRHVGVDKNLAQKEKQDHLFAPRGFLDQEWWHRTYWIYGKEMGGGYSQWPDIGNVAPTGRLLCFDQGNIIYGYGRMSYEKGKGHVRPDMAKDYKLFAETISSTKSKNRKRNIKWEKNLPLVARSIVLTRDGLLIGGGTSSDNDFETLDSGMIWIASRKDGTKKIAYKFSTPPVQDGLILTDRGVFISNIDGSLVLLGH